MNIIIGILLIIYGFTVLNNGLKEEFNIKFDLRMFDSGGKLSPGIWRSQSVEEQIDADLNVELSEDKILEEQHIGEKLGYELVSDFDNEKNLLKIPDNSLSFVSAYTLGLLPDLERISIKSSNQLKGLYFELLKTDNQNISIVAYVSNETYSKQNDDLANVSIFASKIIGEAENAILIKVDQIKVRDIRSVSIKNSNSTVSVIEVDINSFKKIN